MKRTTRFCFAGITVAVVLAIAWPILVCHGTALAKKPSGGGGGGGNTGMQVARIQFTDPSRINSDGQASCADGAGESWDYWDQFDTPLWTQCPDVLPEHGIETSVSGGGRLFFFTNGRSGVLPVQPQRWLALDLTPDPFDPDEVPFDEDDDGIPDSPDIDERVYPEGTVYAPETDARPFMDNVKGTIALDAMFKRNATRQPLDLTIRRFNAGTGGWAPSGWSLHSIDDLYITINPQDKDLRTLQTANPNDPSGSTDADLFELWRDGVTVGIYRIPLKWNMRIVSAP